MKINNTGYVERTYNKKFIKFVFFLSMFAILMMMSIIITVGQITPDYSPVSDTISRMGAEIAPYSDILNTGYIVYGIIIIVIAYNLYTRLDHTKIIKLSVILLLLHAFGSIFLAVFPDNPDIPGGYWTANIIHNTFSGMFYASLLLGIIVYSLKALSNKTTRGIAIFGFTLVTINTIMPFINVVSYSKEISGLLQRFLLFLSYFWVVLTSSILYRRVWLKHLADSNVVRNPTCLASALNKLINA